MSDCKQLVHIVIKGAREVYKYLGNSFRKENYIETLELEIKEKISNFKKCEMWLAVIYRGHELKDKIKFEIEITGRNNEKIAVNVETKNKQKESVQLKAGNGLMDDEIGAALILYFGGSEFQYRRVM